MDIRTHPFRVVLVCICTFIVYDAWAVCVRGIAVDECCVEVVYLQIAVSTHAGAVGASDGLLHVRLAQDRIRQRQVMCETSTSKNNPIGIY